MSNEIKNGVAQTLSDATKPALDQLTGTTVWLHEQGYHYYSGVVSECRSEIEAAVNRAVDKLYPEGPS